jgi:DNA-directed RNA polymerase subunit beta'
MRTFHTGGVFTGELAEQIKAPFEGIIKFPYPMKSRLTRTKHGNEALILEENVKIELCSLDKRKSKLELKYGSLLFLSDNEQFENAQIIGELGVKTNLVTEKVTKDLSTNISGEAFFSDFLREERIDKQGSITYISNEKGIIWILGGDVYTIPQNANLLVSQNDFVVKNEVLATVETTSDHGGIVRLRADSPNDMEIITASVCIENAIVTTESEENLGEGPYILQFQDGKKFLLHCSPGNKISDSQTIGELIDTSYYTKTGGFIKYYVQSPYQSELNYLHWVPEETHSIHKDISLLMISNQTMVNKGQEIIKDLYASNEGFLCIGEENGIVKEVTIKPGYVHKIEEVPPLFEPKIFEEGEKVYPRLKVEQTSYVELIEIKEEKYFLVRPVIKYPVLKEHTYLQQSFLDNNKTNIKICITQKILLRDGEKIRSSNPVNLLKTYLTLQILSDLPHLSADVEFSLTGGSCTRKLKFTIIENLCIKRDSFGEINQEFIISNLVVQNGDTIASGTKVAETKLLCKDSGEVKSIYTNNKSVQNILILTNVHKKTINTEYRTIQVTEGDLIHQGDQIADKILSPTSGQIVKVTENEVCIRPGTPYIISSGTVLQVNHLDLIHVGDILAILVFERPKTGDIIQGLPRIEEILEARKPKEPCRLSQGQGRINLQIAGDDILTIRITENNGHNTEYPIQTSQKFIVSNGDFVCLADPLTDGPPNPHEILTIFFNFYKNMLNLHDAAKLSLQKVQNYLVNEVQSVYQSQNVDISDKHIEVIVRQMTSKVKVEDGGDTTLLPGELVELQQIESINEAMLLTKGLPALYSPVLLGITKSSLNTDSFISAASFQETTRVLTEAAIEGKADWLRGLKENVIIGRLIPAGTGFNSYTENLVNYPHEKTSSIQTQENLSIENPSTNMILSPDNQALSNHSFTEVI